ncbi:MAG TPA: PEGA domain-containing protein [Kofleriaceae bacterium]
MRFAGLGLGLVLVVAFSGCATIMAGGPDHIPVATNPPGATVFVDNLPVGQTPTVVTLDRTHSNGVIRIEMAGFAPIVIAREKTINGWFWANLCLGGVIGIVIDLVTGDIKAFDDTPIVIGLTPGAGGPPPPGYAPPPPGAYPPPPPPPRR